VEQPDFDRFGFLFLSFGDYGLDWVKFCLRFGLDMGVGFNFEFLMYVCTCAHAMICGCQRLDSDHGRKGGARWGTGSMYIFFLYNMIYMCYISYFLDNDI